MSGDKNGEFPPGHPFWKWFQSSQWRQDCEIWEDKLSRPDLNRLMAFIEAAGVSIYYQQYEPRTNNVRDRIPGEDLREARRRPTGPGAAASERVCGASAHVPLRGFRRQGRENIEAAVGASRNETEGVDRARPNAVVGIVLRRVGERAGRFSQGGRERSAGGPRLRAGGSKHAASLGRPQAHLRVGVLDKRPDQGRHARLRSRAEAAKALGGPRADAPAAVPAESSLERK